MIILPLKDQDLTEYHQLSENCGSIFNQLDWLDIFGDRIYRLGIYGKSGSLIGGLFLYQDFRWGLKIIRRAPFTPNSGPFYRPVASNPVAKLEEQRNILTLLAEYIRKENPALSMFPLPQGFSDALPFHWRGFKVIPSLTYLIDLAHPISELWSNMSGTRRNDIRKAQRDGLVVEETNDMRVVRDLVMATFERQKKWLDCKILDRILFNFAKADNSYAYVSFKDQSPVATIFVVHDKSTAFYLLGGYRSENGHHGAGALAMWESIQHAKSLGLKTFDFEGSTIPAIERYFRGFGGSPTSYYTVNRGWFAVETALKLIKRNTF